MNKVWQTRHLADLCDFQNGHAFKNSDYVQDGDGLFEVFRMGNIRKGGGFNASASKALVPPELAMKLRRFVLSEGDILMCMTDMKANPALLGHTAWMPVSGRYLQNQRVGRITVREPEVLDRRFLYYYSNSPEYVNYLRAHANSGVQVNLSTAAILDSPITCPAIETQRRIASILSAYDDLIENNTRRIAILEEMVRRLYEEWFVHFRFPGQEVVRMVESEIGKVPEGWEPAKLGDFATEVRESVDPATVPTETPYVGLEHIPRRSITLSQWGDPASVDSTKLRFRRGEVLFGKIRPYFHKVSIAPFDGICSSDTIVIRPTEGHWLPMVLCCTSSDRFVDHASQTSQGTKMPRANWKVLTKYPLPKPPAELLEQFNRFVEAIVEQTRTLMFQNSNLRTQRDLLLPKLISGEIDVAVVPEPDEEVEAA